MSLYEMILKRRTIRRFKQEPISHDILRALVDAARVAPSAMNMQPLEYIIVDDPALIKDIFVQTNWAGYLPDDTGRPATEEQPVAFIAVLINKQLKTVWTGHDVGAAVENMTLTALEKGIGSCWLGSVKREKVCKLLAITEQYEIDSLLALGYPAEEPVVEKLVDSQQYYKDKEGTLHVPKRDLNSICHINSFTGGKDV